MTNPARLLQLHGTVVDLIYHVDALPQPGKEAIVRHFQTSPGGGFNAMVAARRSGMAVSYGGAIGAGPFGDLVAGALDAEGIDGLRPRDAAHDQGCCTVMIEPSGERTFVAAEGAEGHAEDADFDRLDPSAYNWCLVSGYALYYAGSRAAFTRWLSSDAAIPPVVFDPSPIVASIPSDAIAAALQRAVWISANAFEAAILTGHSDPKEAALALSADRPKGGAVVRTGARGCVVAVDRRLWTMPGHNVTAIDTNGAGDAHLGAFIAALSRGETPESAARYANVAAALSTTQYGPATAPDFATIDRVLRMKEAG